jgi:hypothetical protein
MSRNVETSHPKSSSASTARTPAAAHPVAEPVPTPSTPSVRPRPAGALDTGTVTHKVTVGAYSLVIIYYTSDDATQYRNSSTKTIHVSAHFSGAPPKQDLLVNYFGATADDGTTRTSVREIKHRFAITPPQSYSTVVTIPASSDTASSVTLEVEFDFSFQIAPHSKLYALQTALDSITLPLLPGSST